jgi:hypothetical protein
MNAFLVNTSRSGRSSDCQSLVFKSTGLVMEEGGMYLRPVTGPKALELPCPDGRGTGGTWRHQ